VVKYRTIVADPPWPYVGTHWENNAGGRTKSYYRLEDHYPSMSVEEIAGLSVPTLTETDCRLFLWTTNRHLHDAFHVIEAWGFDYRQMLVWEKTRSTPLGSVAPSRAEFLLVGRRGSPTTAQRLPSSVILASPGRHSTKPDAFMDYIEACSPGPYLELFARRNRLGWDTWGNESLEHVEMAT
jgi:N6-adenosine-specific RNA methylase IME4